MQSFDHIVIGAGVIGASVAFHLARLGARRVLVLEQESVGSGTTAQSSGILRTHYSVRENVELARASWSAFERFPEYVGDEEASAGLVKCGYLIAAPDGAMAAALRTTVAAQQAMGIEARFVTADEARQLLPIARFDDDALIGYETQAGFADAYLVTTGFARAARRLGVTIQEKTRVQDLLRDGSRVVGVSTPAGAIAAGSVICTQNIWSAVDLARWVGQPMPVKAEQHAVVALDCDGAPYLPSMPIFKDLASPGMNYFRSYGGRQMLASEGTSGRALERPVTEQGDIPLDDLAELAAQVAVRFPSYEAAGLASQWTGVYDVTPDWNPVLGSLPNLENLTVGFGFSGHGFKLSPGVGKLLAQHALGLPGELSLAPYSIERFALGRELVGRYGTGAVS